ncbi:fucose-1-phosphate guanylyltransferase [Thalassophryne amazonica]|uniref:fucose-1-phosphate guanylyltransferase n=1 Tax=Thalassophryne amazonica TaxID=390379 RepID=UPI001470AAB9|nr:fucose-1-phosphate guanylyltransferase [Thalassophryne amazonica]
MNQECLRRLKVATREKIKKFELLRGRGVETGRFWDVVVVSAMDESQRQAYELQIREKVERKELPLGVDYKVFSDPPGYKIGNGGSTLYALQHLTEMFGETLGQLKVILIHAGGWSQRLPHASSLGKIFTALPLGEPLYQMLELKLAMYMEFPSHMKPGILVTCADDIEVYSVAENDNIRFDKPGFTALAHPSSLSIGTTHGVFVLDLCEESKFSDMANVSCLQFLHKPSIAQMRNSGAVCNRGSNCLSDTEFVYTDSTYYVDFDTARSLLKFFKEVGTLECEVDAYGDFLQALGPKAMIEYTSNTANVPKVEDSLVEIRKKIFTVLTGTPLNVIVLNNSRFFHIGTMSEYLFHLTEDEELKAMLGLLSAAFSKHLDENTVGSSASCVMYSVLGHGCSVGPQSVVEYSRLEAGVIVGRGCIVSSCWVGPGLSVPDGVVIHSICINQNGELKFVTIIFGINDNLKHTVKSQVHLKDLKLFGLSLEECLSCWQLDTLRFSGDASSCSLWNACLFPVCTDLQSAFSKSLEMQQAVLCGSLLTLPKNTKLISMHEALQYKNLDEMLKFRKELHSDITQR